MDSPSDPIHLPLSVSVGVIGPGLIGSALLRQINQQASEALLHV